MVILVLGTSMGPSIKLSRRPSEISPDFGMDPMGNYFIYHASSSDERKPEFSPLDRPNTCASKCHARYQRRVDEKNGG